MRLVYLDRAGAYIDSTNLYLVADRKSKKEKGGKKIFFTWTNMESVQLSTCNLTTPNYTKIGQNILYFIIVSRWYLNTATLGCQTLTVPCSILTNLANSQVTAFSPLGNGQSYGRDQGESALKDPAVASIADRLVITPAQVLTHHSGYPKQHVN